MMNTLGAALERLAEERLAIDVQHQFQFAGGLLLLFVFRIVFVFFRLFPPVPVPVPVVVTLFDLFGLFVTAAGGAGAVLSVDAAMLRVQPFNSLQTLR